MEIISIALNAVVPFLVFLTIGYFGRKIGAVEEEFLRKLNRTNFRFFFPFVMFNNLYGIEWSTLSSGGYVLFAVAATLILLLISWLLVPIFVKQNARRSVVIQAIYRSNAILFALPVAGSVCGDAGIQKASLLTAFVVPLYNISAVILLEYYRGKKVSPVGILKDVLKNPIIKGAIAGIIFSLLPFELPSCLRSPIAQLAGMATPLALFVLGGTLKFSHARSNIFCLSLVSTIKLVLVPGLMLVIMTLAGFNSVELFSIFCLFATPVATASYPMAQSMGADADLAGEFVVLTTTMSICTLFLWVLVVKSLGIV
ncbi:MAG: AEC family transporter [Eubacterium sp.]|nr:AEC family transporter [Eubacterium sp.]